MEIKVNQKELSKHINIAQKAISSRSTLQILDGILLEAQNNKLKLTGTDLDLSIETFVNCEIIKEGTIVVNSRLFGDIIKKLPDSMVTIKVDKGNIKITCEKSVFNISGSSGEDYPELPLIIEKDSFEIPMDIFKETIRQVVFATSQDETRPSLTGVLLELNDDTISFVALDGYRLALKKLTAHTNIKNKLIIPGKSLNEINKILEDDEIDINITISLGYVIFKLATTIVYSRLLEGQFFNYQDIIREEHNTSIMVNKREFQNSLERASLLAREEKANLVKLNIKENKIKVSSNTEIGNAVEELDSDKNGEDLKIAFNSRYMLDGIKAIESENIRLNFMGNLNPCIMEGLEDENYIYLVLPVRLAQEDF